MARDAILETEGLTKEFRGFVAVKNVNLSVNRGTIHALIGPNGAGKTTCFNLLTHFLTPTRGRIRFNGRDITGSRPSQIARLGLVRSFQISAVFPYLSVLENVRIALQRTRGRSFDFWRSERRLDRLNGQTLELIAAVGLGDFAATPAVELPYGGSQIARQWYDAEKVDVIVDVPNSGVALAVNQITKEKGKAFVVSSAATSDLTGKACSPNTVHWTYDTWALANGTGNAITKTGGDSWFFITADYAFGHALERDTENVVLKSGGKVLGKVRHPLNTQDFSSFLLQAQASKAKIVGLANAGGDTTNAIKQGAEFGIVRGGQNFAGLLVFLTDVHALGLDKAQGLIFTESFYWDMNDKTRAFAKRFAERNRGIHPTMIHAGVYAGVLHYLKAVEALKSDDGTKVIAKMKEMPTDDPLFGKGTIRPDGRKIHPMYLVEVKKPAESKYPWDYYRIRATIPADQAFPPLDQGDCPLVKK